MALPDFLVIGAPKAGSTAVHEALVLHPDLFLSQPKEPKYFLTPDRAPRRDEHRGPGDAHSKQEWVWQREHYERLFDAAPPGALRGESTPFYLWDKAAHLRIRDTVPDAKLIAIIRDPVDRAYSNWTHLWCDGLEPEADFLTACRKEPERIAAGYALYQVENTDTAEFDITPRVAKVDLSTQRVLGVEHNMRLVRRYRQGRKKA